MNSNKINKLVTNVFKLLNKNDTGFHLSAIAYLNWKCAKKQTKAHEIWQNYGIFLQTIRFSVTALRIMAPVNGEGHWSTKQNKRLELKTFVIFLAKKANAMNVEVGKSQKCLGKSNYLLFIQKSTRVIEETKTGWTVPQKHKRY